MFQKYLVITRHTSCGLTAQTLHRTKRFPSLLAPDGAPGWQTTWTDSGVRQAVVAWLKALHTDCFHGGIDALVSRWGNVQTSQRIRGKVKCVIHAYSLCMNSSLHVSICYRILAPMLPHFLKNVVYRMSCDLIQLLHDLIPEAIPSQECHMNICPVSTVTELQMF